MLCNLRWIGVRLSAAAYFGTILLVPAAAQEDRTAVAAVVPGIEERAIARSYDDFCAALKEIVFHAFEDFAGLKGPQLDRQSWRGIVDLPGTNQCRVTEVIGAAYECRGRAGGWQAEARFKQEILDLGHRVDRCLLTSVSGGGRWRGSTLRQNPPGFAKFYKSGRVQIYLTTTADVRSDSFYNVVRIEM